MPRHDGATRRTRRKRNRGHRMKRKTKAQRLIALRRGNHR